MYEYYIPKLSRESSRVHRLRRYMNCEDVYVKRVTIDKLVLIHTCTRYECLPAHSQHLVILYCHSSPIVLHTFHSYILYQQDKQN